MLMCILPIFFVCLLSGFLFSGADSAGQPVRAAFPYGFFFREALSPL